MPECMKVRFLMDSTGRFVGLLRSLSLLPKGGGGGVGGGGGGGARFLD